MTVSVVLTVVYVILATAGLMFAVICLLFNIIFRQRRYHYFKISASTLWHWPCRLVRLSSPNLNYIIGVGAVVLYFNVITLVIPTTNTHFAAVLCNVGPIESSL